MASSTFTITPEYGQEDGGTTFVIDKRVAPLPYEVTALAPGTYLLEDEGDFIRIERVAL